MSGNHYSIPNSSNTITTVMRVKNAVIITLCLLFVITFQPSLVRAEISVSATLSSVSFADGDSAQLSITVNGARSVDLEIPEIDSDAFEIYQRGRTIQNSWINGKASMVVTFTCIVAGYKPGEYTIPPITVRAGKEQKVTDEIPFNITPSQRRNSAGTAVSPPSSSADNSGGETAFIRIFNTKDRSYVGEIIPVEVKAYFRRGLRANLGSAPRLVGDGLVMPQLHGQPVQTQEVLGNTAYSVLTWQTALSNIKVGKHSIQLELDATLLIPQRRMSTSLFGRQSPFDDDFFNSVMGGYKEKPLRVTSDELILEVLPLPEKERPRDFSGAIGTFSFQVDATPNKLEEGEPITLTMTISGTGNFDRVEPPVFPNSADWKTYSPSVEFHEQNGRSYQGEKVFEQAIVAKNPLVDDIPPTSFSYFDPQAGRFITKTSRPIPITIEKTVATQQPLPVSTQAQGTTATAVSPSPHNQIKPEMPAVTFDGMAPLHLDGGKPVANIAPLYKKPFFLTFMLLCILILIGTIGVIIYRVGRDSKPEESRRKQMQSSLDHSFAEIEKSVAANNSNTFLATCRETIQHHLGTLWQCQPGAITRANIASRIPESTGLIEVFSLAEQAAYGGCSLSSEEMNQYYILLKKELEQLI